jgi:hypothetical protein
MVLEEIVVEGSDVSVEKLEAVICGPPRQSQKKGAPWSFLGRTLGGFVNLVP